MKNEQDTINFIREFIRENDNFPSLSIIAKNLGISVGGANSRVRELIYKGKVERLKNMRAYRLTRSLHRV
jgi:predicted transcriptional regulator